MLPLTAPSLKVRERAAGQAAFVLGILLVADRMIDARPQTGTAPDQQTAMRYQPAHQSLITDVFRSRPLLCTIYHSSNCTLARVQNVAVVPAVLTACVS
jgi:hypothetical protein